LLSTVDLSKADWNDWAPTQAVEIMRAEQTWEGADLPALKSLRGETTVRSNDLRDPDLFIDTDGQQYLLYVGGGEQGIGIARLNKSAAKPVIASSDPQR
jgi:beta-xylosidase